VIAMSLVSVVIADPHPRQRSELRALLAAHPRLRVLGATGQRDAAADLVNLLEPDAAVIDLALLCSSEFPLEGWRPISRATRLVAIGPADDEDLDRRLRRAGFAAYLPHARAEAELAGVCLGEVRAAAYA
jgi:DNA-binding NarL/FixJ family response regulator